MVTTVVSFSGFEFEFEIQQWLPDGFLRNNERATFKKIILSNYIIGEEARISVLIFMSNQGTIYG